MRPIFTIRRATIEDADAILDCLRVAFASYRMSYTAEAFADTVLTTSTLAERLGKMTILVAIGHSGQMAGTVAYQVESSQAHIRGMAVRPEWHGCGVADLLLERLQADLRELGCRVITLDTTRPLLRAIRFYEKNGFRATGEIENLFGMDLFTYRKEI